MVNKKIKEKGGGGMKLKGVVEYLNEYWGKKIFMKSVSMLVAACFIVNIANVPVYGQSSQIEEELHNKQIKVIDKHEAVINPTVVKPVNEQIGLGDIKQELLDAAAVKELDRKDMGLKLGHLG